MDATPHQFAYRCLPLNIANSHGWEILTPGGFSACWSGGSGVEAVTVQCDEGLSGASAPVSLFGQGTFTIHIQGLFRTPPGWSLWLSGSPNQGKDGIFPLTAIVETDWSPYTFTMNWKFTRPNNWVRFEAGEPICFVFPVQRGILEQFEPKFVPFEEAPDVARQFHSWGESRTAFQAAVAKCPPAAPKDQWQKRYFRGVDMEDGVAEDHCTRLRLKPFSS